MIKSFLTVTKKNAKTIKVATFIFILSIVFGYIIDPYNNLITESFEKLEELSRDISEEGNVFFTIKTIFFNNITIAMYMIISGIAFGIFPIIILFFNGMFIGVFIKMFILEGQSIILLIIGILPHGVFELTAIILAAAYGMKLGFSLFKTIINLIKGAKLKDYKSSFFTIINETVVFIIGIIIIIFIAAIIESTISLLIINNMTNL